MALFYDGDPDEDGILIGETNVVGLMAAASTNVVQAVWIVLGPATARALCAVVNRDGQHALHRGSRLYA